MREKIAIKSSVIGIFCKIIAYVISFILSKFFMVYLGVEIRGINGVFSNVIGFLQLAELGFGTAIIYALYDPLSKGNIGEIKALMYYYKIIYRIIGVIILFGGACFIPAIPFFMGDSSYSFGYVSLVFGIQLLTSASTYFLAYKRNLMYADQKQYIAVLIDTLVSIVCGIVKILVIIYTKDYVIYLFIQVIQNVLGNLIVNLWCNKVYPYLLEPVTEKYEKKDNLKNNVKNLMIGRIGGWVYSSTDNLIITKFAGLIKVGLLSNYYILVGMLKGLVDSALETIRPIIGNYIASSNDKKDTYKIFMSYSFIRFAIANTVTVGFILLANPVVTVWIGKEFLIEYDLVIWFAVDLFIHIAHASLTDFVNVLGLFKDDRNMALIGAFVNLFFSISLIPLLGTAGVLMGTAISQVYYWCYRGYIVFHGYFKEGVRYYVLTELKYICVTVLQIFLLYYLFETHFFMNASLLMVILKGFICVVTSVVAVVLTNLGTNELKYTFDMLRRNILKKKVPNT